ncbi:MAG: hypothetical protein RLZZ339_3144 [Cyanobacteriota bacterium]|jgi:hypothetical protein|uniref:hypothetical protein n=1 Tax=Microcystis sp. LE19-8.1F TaxID=3016437 RepID=UPI0022CCBAF6|nr:hypothetical protein [Microcystis sp. LE19-8.1F]MCZ8213981.1 hypothetical protein [Microcystis sp. LE19-8.1F]
MLFGSRDVEILSLRGDANRIFAKEVGCGVWGVAPQPPRHRGCGVWGVGCELLRSTKAHAEVRTVEA